MSLSCSLIPQCSQDSTPACMLAIAQDDRDILPPHSTVGVGLCQSLCFSAFAVLQDIRALVTMQILTQ